MADLEKTIVLGEEALDLMPHDDPERARQLDDLVAAYAHRHQRTGAMEDLEKAILLGEEALNLTPHDHPERARRLNNFGVVYGDRYLRTGAMTDLEKSIRLGEEALDLTPQDHSERARRLMNLGVRYGDRYSRTGAMADLENAITFGEKSLDLTSQDDPKRALRLDNLGALYRDRCVRTGVMADIEKAIILGEEALDLTPHDHPERALRLDSLGGRYGYRFQRIGAMADLDKAIPLCQMALDLTPNDHPDRGLRLNNLGVRYGDRYQRMKVIADLEKAIMLGEETLHLTQQNHPDRGLRLDNLGFRYNHRYQQTGAIVDLEKAIMLGEEALDLTPHNHPERGFRLDNLGVRYGDQYQKTRVIADLEKAIILGEEALNLTPHDHPERVRQLDNLGTIYGYRYQQTEAKADLEKCIQVYEEALIHSAPPGPERLRCGRNLLTLYAKAEDWPSAYRVASTSVSLVPLLTPRSLENSDKQHRISQFVDLASDAAAAALMAGETPYEAIRLLELGRGLIMGSLTEMRADVSDLQQRHPRLAEEYVQLRDQLNVPRVSMEHQINQRHDVARRLEKMIEKIRGLSGFGRFLMPPSEKELKSAATDGPIVIANVSDYRCDAFIIEPSEIRALRLPDLYSNDVRTRATNNIASKESLAWLWETVAKPVLDALELKQIPSVDCWPRMWWISTGLLAKFPIQAAGDHSHNSTDTVLDRVILSYSTSVKALVHSRQNRPTPSTVQEPEMVVLVGMPELPFALQEIQKLEHLCNSIGLQVSRPQPCRKEVLSALNDCKIFHFAGHGKTDRSDPSESSLLLANEESLTVASLFESNLHGRKPFLAYLSACGTGQVTHDELIDEGLHLISACQLAGFRHVIGTLWEVNDRSCVDVATMTYEWMKIRKLSDRSVGEGLHHAMRSLRHQWISENDARRSELEAVAQNKDTRHLNAERRSSNGKARDSRDVKSCDDTPLNWIPYVHFGA